MRALREILMLIRLANAELAVRACQVAIEQSRTDLAKAIVARDTALQELNLLYVWDSLYEEPASTPLFLERKDGPRSSSETH